MRIHVATRPIKLEVDKTQLQVALFTLLESFRNIHSEFSEGEFSNLSLPLNLKNYKDEVISEVTLVGKFSKPEKMFCGSNQPFEAFLTRRLKTITFNFNLDYTGVLVFSLIRPIEVRNVLMPMLIHELTHLVDNKSLTDFRRQEKAENLSSAERFKYYFNQDSEIRAHLSQICFTEIDPLFKADKPNKSIEQVIEEITSNILFKNFLDHLLPENRKKLLKDLVTRYQDLSTNEELRKKSSKLLEGWSRGGIAWSEFSPR